MKSETLGSMSSDISTDTLDIGTTFVGTSCVMTVSSSPSRIELVEVCNVSEERVLLATVT